MNDFDALPLHPTSLCMRYQRRLALLRTDTLSPQEAATLTEHVSRCPWCRRELAAYDALDATARERLSHVTYTPLTLEEIRQAAESVTSIPVRAIVGRPAGPGLSRRSAVSALGSLAAVIALTLLAGLLFMTHPLDAIVGSGTPGPKLGGTPTATSTAALAQPTWKLTKLVLDGREQPLVPSHAPWLRFGPPDSGGGSGQIYGTGGCNGIGGSYTIAGESLRLGAFSATQRACSTDGTHSVMEQESAYVNALRQVARFHLDGDTLTLTSGDGNTRLTYLATHSS
jgi:heat shock protein HslJ